MHHPLDWVASPGPRPSDEMAEVETQIILAGEDSTGAQLAVEGRLGVSVPAVASVVWCGQDAHSAPHNTVNTLGVSQAQWYLDEKHSGGTGEPLPDTGRLASTSAVGTGNAGNAEAGDSLPAYAP